MSESLIAQVKRLAEAKAHYVRTGLSILFDDLARGKCEKLASRILGAMK